MRMSVHAKKEWVERVGTRPPGDEEVRDLIENSVRIQKPRDLFTPRGFRIRILALYWLPEKGAVLKVDHRSGKVVTVLSPAVAGTWRDKREDG